MTERSQGKKSSPILVAFAWAIVVAPTLWGLNYTVQNALKIFVRPAIPASAPATVPAK